MAATVLPSLHQDPPEVHLSQYLYVGQESPDYQPGNWFVHNYYEKSRVPSITELIEAEGKHMVPIDLIKKAFDSKLMQNPETLVFALAVCARQDQKEDLRHAAYDALKTICVTPQHFILFVKFASKLGKTQPEPKHGWGNGWRKAVNNWYLSKEALELADCVTRYKGRYGWTHKDIIKLSHPKTDDIAKQAVFKYIMHGMKEVKKVFGDKPEAAKVIQYIQNVEDFKHCEDELQAGRLLELHALTLDHVPGHLLKSEEVWNSLIPTMNLPSLLNNLQRIHNIGLLKPNAPAVGKVIDAFSNEQSVIAEKVHPALIFITIRNYENSGRPLTYEKQKVKDAAKKPLPPPPKPNQKIIDVLYKMLSCSFKHLQPTGLRYMVTIDMSSAMLESKAWHCGNVKATEAGCIIALSLLRCEKTVTVATFKDIGIHVVNLDKNGSFGQTMRRLQQMPTGTVTMEKPMTWAARQNEKYDVFINVVHQVYKKSGSTSKTDNPRKAIKTYRSKMNLPGAKLVTCAMTTTQMVSYADEDKNVLNICGFDANVPKIIEAFAKSLF